MIKVLGDFNICRTMADYVIEHQHDWVNCHTIDEAEELFMAIRSAGFSIRHLEACANLYGISTCYQLNGTGVSNLRSLHNYGIQTTDFSTIKGMFL